MYLIPKCADKLKYSVFWESMDELSLKKFLDFRLKANDLKDRDTEHRQYNWKSLKITMNDKLSDQINHFWKLQLKRQNILAEFKLHEDRCKLLEKEQNELENQMCLEQTKYILDATRETVAKTVVLFSLSLTSLKEALARKLLKTLKPERENAQLRKMRSVDINCLVLGKPFRNIISIKIKENETIGELKRRIKAEKDYFGSCPLDQ
ncbi:hypothetical protein RhiirA4_422649 [Rhizophagus irregularis]|uniref:Crinkler effector protein N-terminal domain-containing protein n=1 Tax=Rhizophagus irregularis TaxID=588596 RepID=A0A2I1GR93_9GLOM|nr:hypothetical protein RhiirA4_422649 [Rhizophagus irregularis]